jgi:acetyltransferase-like isoleucine patch superfamily enzyme
VTIHDNVFIGHNVTFINDKYPEATDPEGNLQTEEDWSVTPTLVEERVSIGSSVTILCGVTIGTGATVGAGSVVTKDIPPGEVWAGNPARFIRKAER